MGNETWLMALLGLFGCASWILFGGPVASDIVFLEPFDAERAAKRGPGRHRCTQNTLRGEMLACFYFYSVFWWLANDRLGVFFIQITFSIIQICLSICSKSAVLAHRLTRDPRRVIKRSVQDRCVRTHGEHRIRREQSIAIAVPMGHHLTLACRARAGR